MNIKSVDWNGVTQNLNERGFALIPDFLSSVECQDLILNYAQSGLYRSTIDMKRYRFGQGEYKYFQYPLPKLVEDLRTQLYLPLVKLANNWMEVLTNDARFPVDHKSLIDHCFRHQQQRPTPLILRYTSGGYNTLHQDLYGEIYFPFQVVIALTQQGVHYKGGELIFTEQLPRAQSRATVLSPDQGDAVIFTTNFRPVPGSRGYFKSKMKHGVSEVKSGERYALGIIFHDAK